MVLKRCYGDISGNQAMIAAFLPASCQHKSIQQK